MPTPPPSDPAGDLDFAQRPEALSRLLDLVGDGAFSVDASGHVIAWSHGAERLTELASDVVVGRPIAAIRVGGDHGFQALVDWLHADALPPHFTLAFRVGRRDGRSQHVVGDVVAMRDDQGELQGAFGTMRTLSDYLGNREAVAEPAGQEDHLLSLVARSAPMREVFRRIRLAANSEVTTLLTGESGTGKELAARALHELSSRGGGPFLAVNCAALPEGLLESELFGHEKGAFTGAVREHRGVLEQADHGTLFLDEIGDIGPPLQVKLLRALQERRIRRVGGVQEIPIDVRLITATNKDLDQLVANGAMREDFYYRIRVYEIAMPPLRERKSDIPLLVEHFRREFNAQKEARVRAVGEAATQRLMAHDWPGNVRELRNAIEHAYVSVQGDTIQPADLPRNVAGSPRRIEDPSTGEGIALSPREHDERDRILDTLATHAWNRTTTAQALGMSRVTLWKKMRRYRIDEGVFRRG
ncbi:MAG: sigma 54-interacting transcriptional regulator [Planctomycetota bacterium]